ncbi:MAG: flavodoxin domain-containing protein [Anaerolineae bacterium]|nr:flavodoxin domain-containing protein [Anaerolineae bacterium]
MNKRSEITRRRFLMLAGGTIGVTTLACCGLTALGLQQPALEFVESNCGGESEMSLKILVAYASKCGSTGKVAEAIGQVLCEGSTAVDVCLAKDVTDVSSYQAVVVGSAIRAGRWLPEAVKFVETHQEALSQLPIAYFAVCLTLKDDTEENRRTVAAYLDPVREMVQPVDVGLFAGALDCSKLSLPLRLMMKVMKSPEGDFRDWDGIRAWAANVRPMLLGA